MIQKQSKSSPYFNPPQDVWVDRFAWDATCLQVVGRTPTRRATIELLGLHDDRHDGAILRIRQRDMSDGYHPPLENPILSE
jgi:hypothetical protein